MRFYWLRDCVKQKQFRIYWDPGSENLADYHTKHHATSHHRNMRGKFLVVNNAAYFMLSLTKFMQGCDDSGLKPKQ